jgi:hypothetical protein
VRVRRQSSSVRSGKLSSSESPCWVRDVAMIGVVASIPERVRLLLLGYLDSNQEQMIDVSAESLPRN